MRNNCILVFATQHMLTGGIESHLLEFCTKLSATGVLIDLIVVNSQMGKGTHDQYRKVCKNVYSNSLGSSRFRMLWLIKIGLQLSFKRYNALYSNGQGESIYIFSKFIFRKKKWIHHHHTSGDSKDQESWGKNYRAVLNTADVIIACSTRNSRDMSVFLDRTIDCIPCFSRKIPIKKNREEGKLRLGYYGRLIPEKGIDLLCMLSQDIDFEYVEFHIWGEGVNYPADYFRKYSNLNWHGCFHGVEELTQALHLLDGFLLLSTHAEGLPICLLESMSGGLPWIASDKGGISDILCDPYATRLIRGDLNYEKVKLTILDFILDFNGGKVSSEKQISYYEENFSSKILVARWGDLISQKI